MEIGNELANLLLPGIGSDIAGVVNGYPERQLPPGAMVTRFAPSPTGMLHIGGLYAALVSERLAHQSGGVFYLRIEDTDKKREVTGSVAGIVEALRYFGIGFDEGVAGSGVEVGAYGPYQQSLRREIYQTVVKSLLERGLAYPCFCDETELDALRVKQENLGMRPGYYGRWAGHRHATLEQIRAELNSGKPFVIRFKSPGNYGKKIVFEDAIKGRIEMPQNDQDIVLLKSDGLPTYHLAHVVDDFLMKTTHVIRGDEWLASVPLHLQLFETLGFAPPKYGHIAPILKREGNSKRKFSKRKDLDAIAGFYQEQGYLGPAVTEYFLTLINSNYPVWRAEHPQEPLTDFRIDLVKMSISGALFDLDKLNDISKNLIATYRADEIYEQATAWARRYDPELFELLSDQPEYSLRIFNIERKAGKPRKDFSKWSDIRAGMAFFYDSLFIADCAAGYVFPANFPTTGIREVLREYLDHYPSGVDHATWFESLKDLAERLGYARDAKTYKSNPAAYVGHVGDLAMILRVALTNCTATPELYAIIQVMGEDRVKKRLRRCLNTIIL